MKKTEVMKERILDINPNAIVTACTCFYDEKTMAEFDFSKYSYIVDAIDTVTSKLLLIENAKKAQTPIISCMGAGNKLDPTKFEVTDIYKTSMCPLAKVMRHELRARGVESLKVVYSKEPAMKPIEDESTSCKSNCVCPPGTQRKCDTRRQVPGSVSFVPSVAGLIIAGEVIKDLSEIK
jgi:tRNA A37 threonylcarbamoyladenosine dehydratase